ncbi:MULTISPECIES: aldo/keto reductase [unclassified Streptomyces]|uniref:aldo/keto reductase n=1 Tax=unclassified Streptomyces TaxID=2593676 RepID=UPI002E35B16F|nr:MULTISPECIES: aldo/keto reductase [unclassified Streptomyces]
MTISLDSHRLLYGCMGVGGEWDDTPYGAADLSRAEEAVEAALDSGITLFDHADIYRHGKAEAVFGEVLSRATGLREKIVIQTKCGIRLGDGVRPGMYDLRGETIVRRVEGSLERLRTDVIDVLLLHRPDPLADPEDVAAALTSLHRQGLVRGFGVSNMGAAQVQELQGFLDVPLVANQLEMSLARRDWLEAAVLVNTTAATGNGFPPGTLEYCRKNGVQLQAWGALAQGRYTGRSQTREDERTARLVAALAEAKNTTPETIVLWWLQRHPARIAPVVGSAHPGRIRACADAAGRTPELTHEEWYDLWLTARGTPLP